MNKIVILDAHVTNNQTDLWNQFKSLGDVTVFNRTQPHEIIPRCANADAVFTNKVILNADVISALPNLKFIGVLATGYNNVDVKFAKSRGIIVSNVPGYSTFSVAQLVFAHLLNIVNRVDQYSKTVNDGTWCKCPDFSYRITEIIELHATTMAIYGLGHIGSEVAKIANAFGMNVISYTSKTQQQLPQYIEKVTKDEMFKRADVLSLNAPLAADNLNFVNAETLALMKPTAILINTARGGLVDEAALADALNQNRLYAAGLDVLSQEPPCYDNPLLKAKNCFITPHLAWQSNHARADLLRISFDNLKAFYAGRPQNVV